MKSSKSLKEADIIRILIDSVDEIENFTKNIGFTALEVPIGFFYSRVIDNRITVQGKNRREYESAVIRAAAFIVVIQLLLYVIFTKDNTRKKIIENSSLTNDQLQDNINKLRVSSKFPIIFNAKIIPILPMDSIVIVKKIIGSMSQLHLERVQTDILGKIFHGLIPFELRKFLAAFYTSNIASEFLVRMVISKPKITILDPSSGSGTMLISAYKRIKSLDSSLSHTNILDSLYGVDVSTFAAQLAEINLVLQNPSDDKSNCNLKIKDIFKCTTEDFLPQETSIREFKVDLLLGNPPFTRADRLDHDYKIFLGKHLQNNDIYLKYNKKYLGFYAYFLLDSLRFLKEEGTLAFVLPLSMINSSTMKPVISFLLEKYAFLYLITSEVQITFSEECTFKEIIFIAKRMKINDSYKTKFVTLKERLTRENINDIVEVMQENSDDYEDDNLRIRLISKKMLLNTININWVVYFYNHQFYNLFKRIVLSNGITFTNQVVESPRYDVDRGLRAGISNFFYLPNKYWAIIGETDKQIVINDEKNKIRLNLGKRYLKPVLRKPSLYQRIIPGVSEYIFTLPENSLHDNSTTQYIRWGKKKFNKKEGFETLTNNHIKKGRKIARVGIAHELSLITSRIVAFYSPIPVIMTDNFIFIRTFKQDDDKIIAAYLNSSIFLLTYLILRREKSGALGQIFGTDMRNFYCLDPKKVTKADREELLKIFDKYIEESEVMPPFPQQILITMENDKCNRFLLDKKICEILKIANLPEFQQQLYEVLNKELCKFV